MLGVATRKPPVPSLTGCISAWVCVCVCVCIHVFLDRPAAAYISSDVYSIYPRLGTLPTLPTFPPSTCLCCATGWSTGSDHLCHLSAEIFLYSLSSPSTLFPPFEMNNKTKQYDTVWSADDPDQEEFLSETDVEEGHEKQWHSDERPTGRRGGAQRSVWSTLRANKGLVDTALLLVVIAMLGLLLLRRPQQSGGRQIGGDYMGAGPECQSPPPSSQEPCKRARTRRECSLV